MTHNANGQVKTTTVSGSTYTGLYAADGSHNIVTNTSTSPVGLYHPCGAYNAFVVTDSNKPSHALNGSINVITTSGGTVLAHPPGNSNFT